MSAPAPLPITARAFLLVRTAGRSTVNEVARALDLSRTSVENAMSSLVEKGLIVEAPSAPSGRGAGRPARHFEFDASAGAVVGVDVGSASVRVVVADLAGLVLQQSTFPGVGSQSGGAMMLADVISNIKGTLTAATVRASTVRAIGVALPAIVDARGRVIRSVVIPEWSGIDIASHLSHEFGCPTAVDGGVRLAAVAEHHIGACMLVDDVIYLSVGNRIAMATILSGRPRRGVHNVAGDIGRLAFQGHDPVTGQIWWRTAETAAGVFERARNGAADSQAELAAFIEDLAHGLATLIMTIDPAMVVVGGGLSRAKGQLLDPLRSALSSHTGLPFQVPLVAARLGAEAAAHGAVVHAFRKYSAAIYGFEDIPAPTIIPLEIDPPDNPQAWPTDIAAGQLQRTL